MNPEAVKQILDTIQAGGTVALNGIAANAVMQSWGNIGFMVLLVLITGGLGWLASWFIRKLMACNSCNNEGCVVTGCRASLSILGITPGRVPPSEATRNLRAQPSGRARSCAACTPVLLRFPLAD